MSESTEVEVGEVNIRKVLISKMSAGWGPWISCDSGWDWILEDLNSKLEFLDPNYKVAQVKEKFGTLRFYFDTEATGEKLKIMNDLVELAERWSSITCESCGNSNGKSNPNKGVKYDETVKLRSRSYLVKTLCIICAIEQKFDLDDSGFVADEETSNK
jgi:hypothetical protein